MHPPVRIILPVSEGESLLEITGQRFHYIKNVLKLKKGQPIVILDGKGAVYDAIVQQITRDKALVEIKGPSKEPEREPPLKITLLQAILKADRMDLVLQKCTELGVSEFWPLVTERTVLRWTRKLKHWQAVVQEATRQCRRAKVPLIKEPLSLKEALDRIDSKALKLIFTERVSTLSWPNETVSEVFILIGPEGGFSKQEEEEAIKKGFVPQGLGPRVLRAETAAVVATALVQFIYGDMNS